MVNELSQTMPLEGLNPKLPKGLHDVEAEVLRHQCKMLDIIRNVYERYGFDPLDTPAIEYSDMLGKFLPDQDRPNEGVFSFQDDDEKWLSLRYDLTAPLARYVAENFDKLPKPFRRYATGTVFRNEKPGPGRFRQFLQFDADTVGAESTAADAEMCMLAADTLEALGIKRGDYIIKISNRKFLDGVLGAFGLLDPKDHTRKLIVMRAIDKLDKFDPEDVLLLLGSGRKDPSGDFTKGAGLDPKQSRQLLNILSKKTETDLFLNNKIKIDEAGGTISSNSMIDLGLSELDEIEKLVRSSGYGPDRIRIDPSVVRGLEYYTGPVFEAEILFEVKNDKGEKVRFGSVGGGGRYDDLVARFTGERIPATGFSVGVSRLQAALVTQQMSGFQRELGPVVVLVMDKSELQVYQKMTQDLRNGGIRAEMYLGSAGMKAQMKYADKRGSPLVVIQGSEERVKGEVTLKDLIEGAKVAAGVKDNKEWKGLRPAQTTVPQEKLLESVREILGRYSF